MTTRLAVALAATLTLGLVGASAAQAKTTTARAVASASSATPIGNCGNLNRWTRNITTRNVTCLTAGRFIGRIGFVGYGNTTMHRGGYTCRVRIPNPRSWWLDVRCTRFGGRVIRWQYESGE